MVSMWKKFQGVSACVQLGVLWCNFLFLVETAGEPWYKRKNESNNVIAYECWAPWYLHSVSRHVCVGACTSASVVSLIGIWPNDLHFDNAFVNDPALKNICIFSIVHYIQLRYLWLKVKLHTRWSKSLNNKYILPTLNVFFFQKKA